MMDLNEKNILYALEYKMPEEFKEICKDEKFWKEMYNSRYKKPFRFSIEFEKVLKARGQNLYKLSKHFNYPEYLCAIFDSTMSEEKYRACYEDKYNELFFSRSKFEQEKIFVACDYGKRTLYQTMRDTIASNILEELICENSHGLLHMNENASDSFTSINTNPDLIFKHKNISFKVELKTKWGASSDMVEFRGKGLNTLKNQNAFCLVYYINDNKGYVIDTTCVNDVTECYNSVGKKCMGIKMSEDPFDFNYSNDKHMQNMLRVMIKMYKKRKIRVAIVGGRDFTDYDMMKNNVNKFLESAKIVPSCIVSGGANGADTLAERYADEKGIKKVIFPADWDKYGKSAGYMRNKDIINNCDICFAFWDGKSKGTANDIDLCGKYNKQCIIYRY